jgi:hypothetical protein
LGATGLSSSLSLSLSSEFDCLFLDFLFDCSSLFLEFFLDAFESVSFLPLDFVKFIISFLSSSFKD